MKTKIMLSIVLIGLVQINLLAQFAGGSGTTVDPYQVQTLEQLQAIGNVENLDKHFLQIADIDATDTENWNNGQGFVPIGNSLFAFQGSYDGNNFCITNLFILRPNTNDVGLFGYAFASFFNIELIDFNINGNSRVGGLLGTAVSTFVINSKISGNIKGGAATGGLIGDSGNTTIIDCYSNCDVEGGQFTGGLIGALQGSIYNSIANGLVIGNEDVGGLIGINLFGLIENSISNGNVSGNNSNIGGLVGSNYGGIIKNSYSTGIITGNQNVGGLIGSNTESAIISTSYSTGNVSGNSIVGGFVGLNTSSFNNCYWDIESSSNSSAVGLGYSSNVTGLNTEQMTNISAYENMLSFEFGTLWKLTASYPALFWEDVVEIFPFAPSVPLLLYPANLQENLNLQIKFTWEPQAYSLTFNLQISADPDFNELLIDVNDLVQPEFTVNEGLSLGSTYYWRVCASNTIGDSDWSEEWSFSTLNELDLELISGESYCFGDQVELSVVAVAEFDDLNVFTIQLSDLFGNFESPVVLGEIQSNSSFTITVNVPESITLGESYLIRVVSSSPEFFSDTSIVTFYQIPTSAFEIEHKKLCWEESTTITYIGNATTNANYNWHFDNGTIITGTDEGPFEVTWPSDGIKNIILNVEENGCSSETSNTLIVNPQTQPHTICMVSVSESNKNMIVWKVPDDNPFETIVIYKESSQTDVYNEIGTQSVSEPSLFIDENSNPSQNSSRYKLAVIDTCGYKTGLSDSHKTMHLTINAGMGGVWNLIWDKYEGFDYSTFHIYRGSSDGTLIKIAEQASNTFTYTDLTPPSGTVYYQIVVVNPNPCDIGGKNTSQNDFSSTRSNIVNSQGVTSVQGIELNNMKIYPNPVSKLLFIETDKLSEYIEVSILTIDGGVINKQKVQSLKTTFDLSNLSNGVYILRIQSGKEMINKKIIKY